MEIDWGKLPNFSEDEIRCKCEGEFCPGFAFMDPGFMNRIQESRTISGVVYPISSGCRCEEWNYHEGGVRSSRHVYLPEQVEKVGYPNALDITWYNRSHLYRILVGLFGMQFDRMKVYEAGWVHVDGGGPGKVPGLFMLG